MDPLLFGQPLPLNLGRASAAEDQVPEFFDQSILLFRTLAVQIRFQRQNVITFAASRSEFNQQTKQD